MPTGQYPWQYAPGGGPWPAPPEGWVPQQQHDILRWRGRGSIADQNANTLFGAIARDRLARNADEDPNNNFTQDQAATAENAANLGFYANPPGASGPGWYMGGPGSRQNRPVLDEIGQAGLDLLRRLQGGGGGGGGGGFHIPGGGGISAGGGAHATHATAEHAIASLIDMLDPAYQREPDANLREDIYSRLSSGSRAAAADQIRGINDTARLAGTGPNAPWVRALSARAEREGAQNATQGLTDFFDQFVRDALQRRAGALDTNARLATGVSQFNAGADNDVSMFNAGADNQVSMFNAGQSLQASIERARLAQSGAIASGQLALGQGQLAQGQTGQLMAWLQFLLRREQEGGRTDVIGPETPWDPGPSIIGIGDAAGSGFGR
jgi:hypothetical protein